jgi:hypothetical protein
MEGHFAGINRPIPSQDQDSARRRANRVQMMMTAEAATGGTPG